MKEKKFIAPNEASLGRWIVTALVGAVASILIGMPMMPLINNTTDTILGIPYTSFFGVITFIPLFWVTVLAIRFIAKTSMKDFLLGVGGKFDKKSSLIVFVLTAIGLLASLLVTVSDIRWRGVDAGEFAFLFVFMLLTAWMQTTWEELVFRGMFIRLACKNNVGYTKKALIACLISSVIFALSHMTNPEVTSQSGPMVLLAVFTYMVMGAAYFVADLHFGSIIPGIIMHWFNNFFLFVFISGEVGAVAAPTLLVDTSSFNIVNTFISVVLTILPLAVYIIIDIIRKKKSAGK